MSASDAASAHAFELRHDSEDGWGRALLVYHEDGRRLEVELERRFERDSSWLAQDAAFCAWSEPAGLALEPEHVDRVLARLERWSAASGLRIEVAPAVDPLGELLARGYALAHRSDGSVIATAPATERGFLARLLGR